MTKKPKAAAGKGKKADDTGKETKRLNLVDLEIRDDPANENVDPDLQRPADEALPVDVDPPAGLEPPAQPGPKPPGLSEIINIIHNHGLTRSKDIAVFERIHEWPPELVKRERRKAEAFLSAAKFLDSILPHLPEIRSIIKRR